MYFLFPECFLTTEKAIFFIIYSKPMPCIDTLQHVAVFTKVHHLQRLAGSITFGRAEHLSIILMRKQSALLHILPELLQV